VELLSVTTKTKTLEVKGGFYSEEDMKTELGYHQKIGSNKHCFHMVSEIL
jgi:hypothetical protein